MEPRWPDRRLVALAVQRVGGTCDSAAASCWTGRADRGHDTLGPAARAARPVTTLRATVMQIGARNSLVQALSILLMAGVLTTGVWLKVEQASRTHLVERVVGCGEVKLKDGPTVRAAGTKAADCGLAKEVARFYVGEYVHVAANGCSLKHHSDFCFQWDCPSWGAKFAAEQHAANIDTGSLCYGNGDHIAGFVGQRGRDLGIELVSSGAAEVGLECTSDSGYCGQMLRSLPGSDGSAPTRTVPAAD